MWDWAPEIVEEWITQVRRCYDRPGSSALFPSERTDRIDLSQLNRTFARYRTELGLAPGLDFHSLRRSYVTHLIETGFDALLCSSRSGTSTPRPPRSTPACRRTTGPRRCGTRWTRRSLDYPP